MIFNRYNNPKESQQISITGVNSYKNESDDLLHNKNYKNLREALH